MQGGNYQWLEHERPIACLAAYAQVTHQRATLLAPLNATGTISLPRNVSFHAKSL
jgi:hypothetical protein